MTLLPALQTAADNAVAGDFKGLHQMILGPSPSGKTTQAREYLAALAQKGFNTKPATFAIARHWRDENWQTVADTFERAKGRILIVEELEKADAGIQKMVAAKLAKMMADNDTLVMVTGAPELSALFDSHTSLQKHMNPPVTLSRRFTAEEQAEYNAVMQLPAEERKTRQRKAEWREARDADLRPVKPITAPKTASFRKPEGAR